MGFQEESGRWNWGGQRPAVCVWRAENGPGGERFVSPCLAGTVRYRWQEIVPVQSSLGSTGSVVYKDRSPGACLSQMTHRRKKHARTGTSPERGNCWGRDKRASGRLSFPYTQYTVPRPVFFIGNLIIKYTRE